MEQIVTAFLHHLKSGQFTNQIYIVIAILTLFEGPLTTLAGAAAASAGVLNPGLVFLSASTGNLAGDIFWHSLGRAGKLNWLLRGNRRLGFPSQQQRD